jgi:hypothetical protein
LCSTTLDPQTINERRLTDIGAKQNSTVIFPIPINIIKPFLDLIDKTEKSAVANGGPMVRLPGICP